jgi:hypothetical protein
MKNRGTGVLARALACATGVIPTGPGPRSRQANRAPLCGMGGTGPRPIVSPSPPVLLIGSSPAQGAPKINLKINQKTNKPGDAGRKWRTSTGANPGMEWWPGIFARHAARAGSIWRAGKTRCLLPRNQDAHDAGSEAGPGCRRFGQAARTDVGWLVRIGILWGDRHPGVWT